MLNWIDKVLVVLLLSVSLTVASLPSTCTLNGASALPSFLLSTTSLGIWIVRFPLSADADESVAISVALLLSNTTPKSLPVFIMYFIGILLGEKD